jgi:hypothetical protein
LAQRKRFSHETNSRIRHPHAPSEKKIDEKSSGVPSNALASEKHKTGRKNSLMLIPKKTLQINTRQQKCHHHTYHSSTHPSTHTYTPHTPFDAEISFLGVLSTLSVSKVKENEQTQAKEHG